MFQKLSHPMMYVTDLDRARRFYTETLGFRVNYEAPKQFASLFHAGMSCRLDLHATEANSKDVGFGPLIYFLTSDMDRDLESLKSKGVKVGEPRREGDSPRFVTFWDSEGNALGLEEEWKR